jgi:hypothetical protein
VAVAWHLLLLDPFVHVLRSFVFKPTAAIADAAAEHLASIDRSFRTLYFSILLPFGYYFSWSDIKTIVIFLNVSPRKNPSCYFLLTFQLFQSHCRRHLTVSCFFLFLFEYQQQQQ